MSLFNTVYTEIMWSSNKPIYCLCSVYCEINDSVNREGTHFKNKNEKF